MTAQNQFDGVAYANCFSETAVVFDEGKKRIREEELSMNGSTNQIKSINR